MYNELDMKRRQFIANIKLRNIKVNFSESKDTWYETEMTDAI